MTTDYRCFQLARHYGCECDDNPQELVVLRSQLESWKERAEKAKADADNLRDLLYSSQALYEESDVKLAIAVEALETAFKRGHNLDCLFCGFKDKVIVEALAKIKGE